jgi:hypothetical protein
MNPASIPVKEHLRPGLELADTSYVKKTHVSYDNAYDKCKEYVKWDDNTDDNSYDNCKEYVKLG